jgi:uroporphyrinogen-III synthase
VVTSSNAIECLDDDAASRLRDLPLVCVGERTRDIAARRGFDAAQAPAADVAALIAALRARPAGTRFLYLAGRDRKPSLESALQNMGHVVATSDVYEARAELSLTPETIAALRQGAIDAAFNFSRRSSELLIELSRSAGVLADLGRVAQICISGDAAEPLRLLGARVIVADAPTSVGLFAALDFV